jgi:hypothetical protein
VRCSRPRTARRPAGCRREYQFLHYCASPSLSCGTASLLAESPGRPASSRAIVERPIGAAGRAPGRDCGHSGGLQPPPYMYHQRRQPCCGTTNFRLFNFVVFQPLPCENLQKSVRINGRDRSGHRAPTDKRRTAGASGWASGILSPRTPPAALTRRPFGVGNEFS